MSVKCVHKIECLAATITKISAVMHWARHACIVGLLTVFLDGTRVSSESADKGLDWS